MLEVFLKMNDTNTDVPPSQPHCMTDRPTSYYWSGNAIRSRSVSDVVLFGWVDVPAPALRLMADWQSETLRLDI